jgi:hypothetical protein
MHSGLLKLSPEDSRGDANSVEQTKNVPYPTNLPVGADVRYHKRLCTVIVRQGDLYMIKDKKNRQTWWVKPDQVEIASLV